MVDKLVRLPDKLTVPDAETAFAANDLPREFTLFTLPN